MPLGPGRRWLSRAWSDGEQGVQPPVRLATMWGYFRWGLRDWLCVPDWENVVTACRVTHGTFSFGKCHEEHGRPVCLFSWRGCRPCLACGARAAGIRDQRSLCANWKILTVLTETHPRFSVMSRNSACGERVLQALPPHSKYWTYLGQSSLCASWGPSRKSTDSSVCWSNADLAHCWVLGWAGECVV